ncbi:GMC family oxidoreductase N-terminal domain-containing protein [Haloechinothrix sp. YIM 98757]|uniref:GMC family oxidoreductase N-terminal domain-containing protein n=1 Tax=Haloechinothrix aidingensis TaxID=2752311 RepID=A0A838AC21_9PSEU|nr:GMC family oxidoreductase N-terminal domain-containing protein [Haloechinothrix aidingensis]MBA0126735.1 GMC family oxidoreductase N-terminal domain-containing protein [Haloechinothrix aidingensis]
MRTANYDYVVVGGGSSGAIVGSRLAEGGAKVLLLEAGGTDRRPDVLIPAGVVSAYQRLNWKYPVEPDPTRTNSPEAWMAGKVLGGGGSINSCVYVRGNRADFDGWAKLGCSGWDYDSVLPSFKRMESWERGANEYRGGDGPISVKLQGYRDQANLAYLESALQAGHPRTEDYNGAIQDGVDLIQVNHRQRGTRSQASREYLRSVAPKGNLTVQKKAMVHRVLFDGDRAIGVEYRLDGKLERARVREEVILCAGSLSSPKILMLSGIGPRDTLNEFDIDVVHVNPGVGANLHDHAFLMQRWHANIPTANKMRASTLLKGLRDYALYGSGMLAITMVQVQVMHKTDPARETPDLQLQFVPVAITRGVDEDGAFNVQPAKYDGFLASSTLLHPRARGTVSLRSSDPEAPPLINYQYLAEEEDVRDIISGAWEVRRIMEQPAIADLIGEPFEPEAMCRTDADWKQYAREYVTSSYHPVGTCKMGNDDRSVVDPELRVNGVKGLRVADASIMPTVTSGNTNAPAMMIGERAAELILRSA